MTQLPTPFEFFPPKNDEQVETFKRTRDRLAALKPEYMSVTFGAGGSTRARTRETVFNIQREAGISAAPHISCMSEDIDSINELLDSYRQNEIERLVVLRGDKPSGRRKRRLRLRHRSGQAYPSRITATSSR